MTEKSVTIARVEVGATQAGKTVAELYSADTRLQYPVLILFDLAMLESVGIDPNALVTTRQPIHRRFVA
jgi:hypothetical protein